MKKNTSKDYVSIRVYVVHVKKRRWGLGFNDKEIGHQICIPDSWEDADKLVGEISKIMEKYGHSISI